MIRDNSVDVSMGLGDRYATKGTILSPVEGSPLAALCRTSNPLNAAIKDYDPTVHQIAEQSKTRRPDGSVPHDDDMEDAVEYVSNIVRNNLKLARTVVNPIVARAVENVQETVAKADETSAQPLAVVEYEYDDIWNNPILESFVGRYSETPAYQVERYNGMPDLSADELEASLKQEVSRFDDELSELVTGYSEQWLKAVYHSGFTTKGESPEMVENDLFPLGDMLRNPRKYPNELLVIFAMSRHFQENVPEGTTIELTQYKNWMTDIQSQVGRGLYRVLERREMNSRQNTLLHEWPMLNINNYGLDRGVGYITVNSDVYRRWLDEGGSPETLMGAFVTDKESGYKQLLENREGYEKAWKRQERILASESRHQRFNRTLQALEKSVAYEINSYNFEDKDQGDSLRQKYHGELKRRVRRLSAKDVCDERLYDTVRSTICKIMFDHTEAETVLFAIDEIGKENPDMDVREAAFLAVIDVVAEWASDQIAVDNY